MPTVLDSFVIELGLDSSKFTKGQRDAYDAAKRLEDQQEHSAKNIEYSAGKASGAIGGLKTQALEMLAVLTGGAGVIRFATNLTHADAAVGRLERNLGISSATISKWQGVARIMGGDAASMAASFTSISDAFAGWKIGMVTPLIADLRAISTAGGKIIDVNKGVEQSYLDLAENLRNINARDPAQAGLLGRRIGLPPELFDAMIAGNLQKILDYVLRIGVATSADTDAFGELEKRMNQMGLKAESLGRKLLGAEGGGAAMIIAAADFLNKTPGEAGKEVAKTVEKSGGFWGFMKDTMTFNWWKDEQTKSPSKLFPDQTSGAASGRYTSQGEKEQDIRSEAAKRGINPNIAMYVARREGFDSFVSSIPGEKSYGAFQLHVTPGGRGGHLGDQFRAKTGLDPANPDNERATIRFALDDVTKHGWKAFHGAKNSGIGQWDGVNRGGSNSTTTEININGPITITPPAGAAPDAWANQFLAAVKRQGNAAQANSGGQ